MLYTNEANPQVIVTVDSLPALCVSLACDYTYINPTGIITGQSVSGNTVTVDGTSLPTDNITDIIAGTDCTVISISDT